MCSRLAFPGAAEKPKRKTASATAKKAGTTTKKAGTATKKKGMTTKKTAAKKAAPKKPGPKPKAPVKKVPLKITSDMLPPKQPLSPFFRFSAELRKTQPKSASRDEASTNAKEAGRLWNELPEEEKRSYREAATADAAQHQLELLKWWKNADPQVIKAINARRARLSKRKLSHRRAPEDRRPMASGYTIFITEAARDKMDGEGLRLTDYAARWRGLSEAEKKVYVDRAAKDIAEYQEKKAAKAGDA